MATLISNKLGKIVTGKIDKNSNAVLRVKKYRDPLTGEIIGYGPNEYYIMHRRNIPATNNQVAYREKFKATLKLARSIMHDKLHPRHRELFELYINQLYEEKSIKRFENYIVSILIKELKTNV